MSQIQVRELYKSYGKTEVLKNINLEIQDGELTVLVGPSGCGKSTLLRMICGLEDISSGDILIDNQVVNQVSPALRGISMVFQSYALYPHMTVRENLAFGLLSQKIPRPEIDARIQKASEMLKIDPLLDRKPKQLSGGQRQRVAIGRSLVRQPKVYLFDEPLSNLDAALRVGMRLEIAKLKQNLKATMVYVTHDQVEAMTLADKIVILNAGRIEQVGHPLELYHYPQNQFVAGFLGSPSMNFLHAQITAAQDNSVRVRINSSLEFDFPVAAGTPLPAVGEQVIYGIRPENLHSPHRREGSSGYLALSGKLDTIERMGDQNFVYYHVQDLESSKAIISRVHDYRDLSESQEVNFVFRPAAGHLFLANSSSNSSLNGQSIPKARTK